MGELKKITNKKYRRDKNTIHIAIEFFRESETDMFYNY